MASNLDRTLNFIALWSRIDMEAILSEMAPDCIYHNCLLYTSPSPRD